MEDNISNGKIATKNIYWNKKSNHRINSVFVLLGCLLSNISDGWRDGLSISCKQIPDSFCEMSLVFEILCIVMSGKPMSANQATSVSETD